MKIHQIYVEKSDLNPYVDKSYFYVVEHQGQAIAFDPGLFSTIDSLLQKHQLNLIAILNTHHHPDHVGGNMQLKKKYSCPVYCSEYDQSRVPGVTNTLKYNETLKLLNIDIKVVDLKAHTLGLIGFYIESLSALFPGDALFSAGCGRLFEGDAGDLLMSMKTIASLPQNTNIYCSHEYTLQNLKFAKSIEPENLTLSRFISEVEQKYNASEPTVPFPISFEFEINPFLKCINEDYTMSLGFDSGESAIKHLRVAKDNFR